MVEALLGLGGNLGPVAETLRKAVAMLGDTPGITDVDASRLFRTPPWGKLDQPPFLNMAVRLQTTLPARALLARCNAIEAMLGRVRGERWGPRAIDIDILAYGDARIEEPGLTVPHPRVAERAFVLVPLRDLGIAALPDGRDVDTLLAALDLGGIEPS